MLASVAEAFVVYPIKSRNAAEQEATQDSTVIFLVPEFANDSSCGNPERLYTRRLCESKLTLDYFRLADHSSRIRSEIQVVTCRSWASGPYIQRRRRALGRQKMRVGWETGYASALPAIVRSSG